MLARIQTAAIVGVDACPVTVEVDARRGGGAMPGLNLVGLPSTRVSEGKVRIRAALLNSDFKLESRRVTINLAPADLQKDTAAFDLPIAIALLAAFDRIPATALEGVLTVGELALDGALRPVLGVLPAAALARSKGLHTVIVPAPCAAEAAVVEGVDVRAATHLADVVAHLEGGPPFQRRRPLRDPHHPPRCAGPRRRAQPDRGEARPRDRRRWWAQPRPGGTAGSRQVHARPPPARHLTAAHLR